MQIVTSFGLIPKRWCGAILCSICSDLILDLILILNLISDLIRNCFFYGLKLSKRPEWAGCQGLNGLSTTWNTRVPLRTIRLKLMPNVTFSPALSVARVFNCNVNYKLALARCLARSIVKWRGWTCEWWMVGRKRARGQGGLSELRFFITQARFIKQGSPN